jgi:drug/metabolite transporter (DMT)-like permease
MSVPALAVAAVLTGAFLHATWNVGVRGGPDRNRSTALLLGGAALIAAALLPALPAPRPEAYGYIARSVLLHIVYFTLVAKAYERAGLSLVYPAMRGTAPVLTSLVAVVFLGEPLSPAGWVGIILISSGVVLMAQRRGVAGELAGLVLALVNAIVIAAYTVNDAFGARASAAPLSYTLWIFLLCAAPAIVLLLWGRKIFWPSVSEAAYGVGSGACSVASYTLALWALTRAPIAPIAALRETSMVFGIALAYVFLGERPNRRGWTAVMLIIAGAVLLRLA